MASSSSSSLSLLLPLGPTFPRKTFSNYQTFFRQRIRKSRVQCSAQECPTNPVSPRECEDNMRLVNHRDIIGCLFGMSNFSVASFDAEGAGMPPEEKPKLCDAACEKELENVPMVTTESGLQYMDIKIGGGPSPPVGFRWLQIMLPWYHLDKCLTGISF